MIQKIINKNSKKFLEYNGLRQQMFAEYSPKDSDIILYMLPWLLSINHPDCPGYLLDIETLFWVHDIKNLKGIKEREPEFKSLFSVDENVSLIKLQSRFLTVQGLYTIGSVGTISQTPESDCDIWVCYDKEDYNPNQLKQLHKKIYLIGEWIDENCRIPVHFFISDVGDIKNCIFGSVDEESSGSAQANVLKEEFYRTCMIIAGKIPLWWVSYDASGDITYDQVVKVVAEEEFWDDSYVDLGNLENVAADEYFGSALWQVQKSLERPLKSIIKMFLLKMQLDASDDELVCHKFRQHIMVKQSENMIPDPSVFAMFFIMTYYLGRGDIDTIEFIKDCYYLRCEIKPYSKKYILKNKLAGKFFNQFEITKEKRERLNRYSKWDLNLQISFGKQIFKQLLKCYRDIIESHSGVSSRIGKRDLTIVGRKIQVYYESKKSKIIILPKSTSTLNIAGLTFMCENDFWQICSGNDNSGQIVKDRDIVFAIAFVVRNQIFEPGRIHMLPNSSSVAVSEIISLGSYIETFFKKGSEAFKQSDFLKKAFITKVLVVISFDEEPWEKTGGNIKLVYVNSWGEMFVEKIDSPAKFKIFIKESGNKRGKVLVDYYLQKKCLNYSATLNEVKKYYSV